METAPEITIERPPIEEPRSPNEVVEVTLERSSHVEQLPTVPTIQEEKSSQYRGRLIIWPGSILLTTIVCGAIALIIYFSLQAHDAMVGRRVDFNKKLDGRRIIGGDDGTNDGTGNDSGTSRNPANYPPRKCALPSYVTKNGKIYAEGPKGEKVAVGIKGINWSGMETSLAIPFGLWANDYNGTTVYEVASFLAKNRFNSIRLPLCVAHILKNQPPRRNVINQQANKAINITNYVSTISSIVKSLAYRNITVLLDLHTLTPEASGGLPWTTPAEQEDFLSAVDILTSNFCNGDHWNIIGLDLKNEPYLATWGDGSTKDFRLMAQAIGNRMLVKCPNWLAFVEGISSGQSLTIGKETFAFSDWWGGGLENAGDAPVELGIDSKLVYSPHYYNPAVYPQLYFLKSGLRVGDIIVNFEELDDAGLYERVEATVEHMFGHLTKSQDGAIVLGEFGGLYSLDEHPMKTTQRVTQILIELMKKPGYGGGYLWTLNPESAFQFNPSDTRVTITEGLLTDTWLQINEPFLKAMQAMDSLPDLQPFPCFNA